MQDSWIHYLSIRRSHAKSSAGEIQNISCCRWCWAMLIKCIIVTIHHINLNLKFHKLHYVLCTIFRCFVRLCLRHAKHIHCDSHAQRFMPKCCEKALLLVTGNQLFSQTFAIIFSKHLVLCKSKSVRNGNCETREIGRMDAYDKAMH